MLIYILKECSFGVVKWPKNATENNYLLEFYTGLPCDVVLIDCSTTVGLHAKSGCHDNVYC